VLSEIKETEILIGIINGDAEMVGELVPEADAESDSFFGVLEKEGFVASTEEDGVVIPIFRSEIYRFCVVVWMKRIGCNGDSVIVGQLEVLRHADTECEGKRELVCI